MPCCAQAEPPAFEHDSEQTVMCWLYDSETMQKQGQPTGIPEKEAVTE